MIHLLKIWSLGLLLLVSSAWAQKGDSLVIDHDRFVKLERPQQREYILNLQQVIVAMEETLLGLDQKHSDASGLRRRLDEAKKLMSFFFVSKAHAQSQEDVLREMSTDSRCIYGGWFSSYITPKKGPSYCTGPQNSVKMKAIYAKEGAHCKAGKVACNPDIFGYDTTGKAICVNIPVITAQNASLACLIEFNTQDNLNQRLDAIIERASLPANKVRFNQTVQAILNTCFCGGGKAEGEVIELNQKYASYMQNHRTCNALMAQMSALIPKMREQNACWTKNYDSIFTEISTYGNILGVLQNKMQDKFASKKYETFLSKYKKKGDVNNGEYVGIDQNPNFNVPDGVCPLALPGCLKIECQIGQATCLNDKLTASVKCENPDKSAYTIKSKDKVIWMIAGKPYDKFKESIELGDQKCTEIVNKEIAVTVTTEESVFDSDSRKIDGTTEEVVCTIENATYDTKEKVMTGTVVCKRGKDTLTVTTATWNIEILNIKEVKTDQQSITQQITNPKPLETGTTIPATAQVVTKETGTDTIPATGNVTIIPSAAGCTLSASYEKQTLKGTITCPDKKLTPDDKITVAWTFPGEGGKKKDEQPVKPLELTVEYAKPFDKELKGEVTATWTKEGKETKLNTPVTLIDNNPTTTTDKKDECKVSGATISGKTMSATLECETQAGDTPEDKEVKWTWEPVTKTETTTTTTKDSTTSTTPKTDEVPKDESKTAESTGSELKVPDVGTTTGVTEIKITAVWTRKEDRGQLTATGNAKITTTTTTENKDKDDEKKTLQCKTLNVSQYVLDNKLNVSAFFSDSGETEPDKDKGIAFTAKPAITFTPKADKMSADGSLALSAKEKPIEIFLKYTSKSGQAVECSKKLTAPAGDPKTNPNGQQQQPQPYQGMPSQDAYRQGVN